jgi:hypothetical protein
MAAAQIYEMTNGKVLGVGMATHFKQWLEKTPVRDSWVGGRSWRLSEPSVYALF